MCCIIHEIMRLNQLKTCIVYMTTNIQNTQPNRSFVTLVKHGIKKQTVYYNVYTHLCDIDKECLNTKTILL